MKRMFFAVLVLLAVTFSFAAQAGPRTWIEGRDYVVLDQVQPTHVPAGKVEVLEVFSYGCPFCNDFQPVMAQLEHALPPNARLVLLPASFSLADDMPMFQRAFFAAQSLGVERRAHQAMFDAVWKTGELAVYDPATHRPKSPAPTLADAARSYARITGIRTEDFLRAAHSFAVDARIRTADEEIIAMQVPGTPCLVVNGRYRLQLDALTGSDEIIDLVKFLITKDSSHAG